MRKVLFIVATAATGLAAQERDTTASDTSRAATVRLPALVVTGTVTPAAPAALGFAVTTVGRADLARRKPVYAADALRDLPGTFIDEAVGPGGPTIVRLRGGEEVFTQILMDGVETNQNGGFFDFQGLTLTNVERVEVARGPQSAVYGSSAVSGVVHFITAPGIAGPPRVEVTAEGGDATRFGGSFRTSGVVRGGSPRLRYSAGGGVAYSRGIYALPNDIWTRDASLRIDLAPSDRWDLTGTLRYALVDASLPVRDPGATRVPLDPNARDENERFVTSVQAQWRASPAWSHRVRGFYFAQDFLYEDEFDDVASTGSYPFFIFDATFTFRSRLWRAGADYLATHRLQPADGLDVAISYGGQLQQEELTDRTAGDFGEGVLPFERGSGALLAEAQLDLHRRLAILGGARLDKYENLAAQLTPRMSAAWRLLPDRVTLRAAAGRAYKAPNLQQQYLDNPFIVANPDLEPETSVSWEVGLLLDDDQGRLHAEVGFFRQEYRNLIRTVDDSASGKQINRNLGSSHAIGVEWALRYRFHPNWLVGTDGAWIRTTVDDNAGLSATEYPVGKPLPFRPSVTAAAFVGYEPHERLQLTVRSSVIGPQTVLSERFSGMREAIDGYILLGGVARYRLTSQLEVYARVDNLLDVAYQTAFDRPGIPATAAIGVQFANR